MFTIYVYVLDALADWELGYVISEVNSGRFFKKDAQRVSLKTVSYSGKPIKTCLLYTSIRNGLSASVPFGKTVS